MVIKLIIAAVLIAAFIYGLFSHLDDTTDGRKRKRDVHAAKALSEANPPHGLPYQ